MEITFPAELWQAGEAWVAGIYTKMNLWTLDDLKQAFTARKNFWIPGKWNRSNYWVFGILYGIYLSLIIFTQIFLNPWTVAIPAIGMLVLLMILRHQMLRQFIALGPRGVLYRNDSASRNFLWMDIKQIYVKWKIPSPGVEGSNDIYCDHKLHCISHTGTEFVIGYSDADLIQDEVKSFDMLRDLFEVYWGQKVVHKLPPGVRE